MLRKILPIFRFFKVAKCSMHSTNESHNLLENHLYEIDARNSCVGLFQKSGDVLSLPGFEIARSKCGRTYLFFEFLHEAHDIYGTATAKKIIEKAPQFLNDKQKLDYLLTWRDKIDPSYTMDDKRIAQEMQEEMKLYRKKGL